MKRKTLLKRLMVVMLMIAMVMWTVPVDGLVMVARAEDQTSISYVDANGEVQTAEKVDVVTTAMEGYEYKFVSAYDDGWLYVKNDVTLNGASNNASYPIKLILGDNATLTINGYLGISYVDLTIYCQSGGTGKLVINANCISNPALFIANSRTLTINGGTVEVKNSHVSGGFGGNLVMNGGTASFEGGGNGIETGVTQTVAFKGGSLTAVGGGWGISDGTVTLDYKDSTDQIKVSSYSTYSSSTVTIADGKYFKDDDGNLYSGTLTKEQKTAIAGKTLKPAIFHDISVDSSMTGGSITAATTIAAEASSATGGQTVTLTAAPDEGYELDTVTVTKAGSGTVATNGTGNTRTFTMPEEAVTVSATFTLAPKTGSCGASASDHVTYTLTDTDKDNKYDKLEIAGTGAMADFQADGSNLPWYDHRENIEILTIAEGVTRIGTGAFRNVAGITSVTIPASVTGIGDNAFASDDKDTALTTVSFASGSQCRSIGSFAFNNRRGLTGITLPAALESIGGGVFYMNKALTSINIPAKVTSIGEGAFQSCDNLATVRILGSPATIGSRAFYAGASTPNGLTVYAPAVNKTDALESLYESSTGSPRNLVYICTAPEAPAENSFTYNGAEQTVAIAAPANCGYTVTGDKQTNVGSYTATATLNTGKSEEKGIYNITITKQYVWGDASTLTPAASGETDAKTYAWSIKPKSISGVTVAAIPDQTYAGSAIKPAVTVKDGTKTLILDTDYTVEYSNNTNAASKDDASAPTVTIKGKGNYAEESTLTATFNILPKPVTINGITAANKKYDGTTSATLNYTSVTFTGKADNDTLTVTATGDFADANAGNNKTVNISNLVLGGASANNYKLAESGQQTTATATISKADIPTGQITPPTAKNGLTYTGSAQQLIEAGNVAGSIGTMYYTVTSTDTAPADNLYTTSIPAKTDAGTYYVWYKVIGDANHNDRTPAHIEVSIGKAAHSPQTANGSAKYGTNGTVDLSALIVDGGTVGTITKNDTNNVLDGDPSVSDGKLNFAFADTAGNADKTATVTIPITSTNYLDYNITVMLTVNAKDVPILTVDPITKTYDGAAVTGAQISGTATVNGMAVAGTLAFENGASFVNAADSGAKKVIFTPEDTDNYDKAEVMLALTINKAVITIKAADKSIYVGDTVPSLDNPVSGKDYTVTGLVGSDQLAGTLTLSYSATPDNTKAGSYTITPGGAAVPTGGNYADDIVYQTGTLTIKVKSGGGSGSGGGGGSGSGSGGSGSSEGGDADPGKTPEPGSEPTIVEQKTETTKNPDGSTTTTTTTTDSEGTKTTESETVKADGTVEKSTETIKADGSTEKSTEKTKADGSSEKQTEIVSADGSTKKITETTKPNGASEKVTDIAKANGATIHEEVKTTAKGKETSQKIETSASGSVKITEQVKQPSGDHSKVVMNKTGKKTVAIKQATTTAKNGKVTIPKTVNANGEKLKVTALKKNFLKGSETKPKEITINASNITKVAKGAFDYINKKAVIKIVADKKDYKRIQKLIKKSGIGKGVKIKRVK